MANNTDWIGGEFLTVRFTYNDNPVYSSGMRWFIGGGNNSFWPNVYAPSGGPPATCVGLIQNNVWQHLVVTCSNHIWKTYYNGVLQSSHNLLGDIVMNPTCPTGTYGGYRYGGLLDDLMFYNKPLTASQVLRLYQETSPAISSSSSSTLASASSSTLASASSSTFASVSSSSSSTAYSNTSSSSTQQSVSSSSSSTVVSMSSSSSSKSSSSTTKVSQSSSSSTKQSVSSSTGVSVSSSTAVSQSSSPSSSSVYWHIAYEGNGFSDANFNRNFNYMGIVDNSNGYGRIVQYDSSPAGTYLLYSYYYNQWYLSYTDGVDTDLDSWTWSLELWGGRPAAPLSPDGYGYWDDGNDGQPGAIYLQDESSSSSTQQSVSSSSTAVSVSSSSTRRSVSSSSVIISTSDSSSSSTAISISSSSSTKVSVSSSTFVSVSSSTVASVSSSTAVSVSSSSSTAQSVSSSWSSNKVIRWPKGTAQDNTSGSTLTLANVTLSTGDSIIVQTGQAGNNIAVSTVTWGGTSLGPTADKAVTGPASVQRVEIWSAHGVTGGTNTVTVTWVSTLAQRGMVVTAVTGITGKDQTNSSNGFTGTPTSGSVTTTKADEYLCAAVVRSVTGDSWGNSFSTGQAVTVPGAGVLYLSEGYRIVETTGSYTATKDTTSGLWTAALVTYFVSDAVISSSLSSSSTAASVSSSTAASVSSSSSTQLQHLAYRAEGFSIGYDESFNGDYYWMEDREGDITDVFTNGSRYLFLVWSLNAYVLSDVISIASISYQSADPWPTSAWTEVDGQGGAGEMFQLL